MESRLRADKPDKVIIPRISDSRAVCHDQDIAGIIAFGRLQTLAEVVCRQRFSETRLCIPEKFSLFMAEKIVKRL